MCGPQRHDGTLTIMKTQNRGEAATKSEVLWCPSWGNCQPYPTGYSPAASLAYEVAWEALGPVWLWGIS